MINVSSEWEQTHQQRILPESFLEIRLDLTDDVAGIVNVSPPKEAVFSNSDNMVGGLTPPTPANYATLEHNRWALDGTKKLVPDSAPYDTPGLVGFDDSVFELALSLSEQRMVTVPGFTITWDSEYGEHATSFEVAVFQGSTVLGRYVRSNNTSSVSEVSLDVVNYDRANIVIREWSTPSHRPRIDRVCFGLGRIFEKTDILNYTHEQNATLNSSELPKASVDFTANNADGKWNPSNPEGLGQYLSERQPVTVRYGLDVNGTKEWVKAGRFYLSQWEAKEDGFSAKFVARDIFEFLLNEPYTGPTSGTLFELATAAISGANLPSDFSYRLDSALDRYSATITEPYTVAEVLQMCANAATCVMWQDRDGVLRIEPLDKNHSNFAIMTNFAYHHPRVELTKPLRAVSVAYGGEQPYVLSVGSTGETQTVDNPLVGMEDQAVLIADWVKGTTEPRTVVSGEFRADPRLDVFDIVSVESKYGLISPVALTEIVYTYTGAMRAKYVGRVISGVAEIELFVLDKSELDKGVL